MSKRGRIYESATENQKRDWIGKKHADEFEIVKYENMNHIELSVELMSILRALNYSCELKTIEGKSIVMDIAVQGELSVRHKMIEMLLGGFLSEFIG